MHKALVSDLAISFVIVSQSKRVVFEPQALAFEESSLSIREELDRNIRTITQGLAALLILKKMIIKMFNPRHLGFFTIQLVSHKLLRWLSPLLLLSLLIINLLILFFIKNHLYLLLFLLQVLFYIFSYYLAFSGKNLKDFKLLSMMSFFSMYNLAALIGLYKFLQGEKRQYWQTKK